MEYPSGEIRCIGGEGTSPSKIAPQEGEDGTVSFLDRLKQVGEPKFDTQRAVMTVVVAAVTADGSIDSDELLRMRAMCSLSPIFADNTGDQDLEIIKFAANINDQLGEQAIVKAAAALSPTLCQTAFAFACDMILADGVAGEKEQRFLGHAAHALGVNEATADAVIMTTLIRNFAS